MVFSFHQKGLKNQGRHILAEVIFGKTLGLCCVLALASGISRSSIDNTSVGYGSGEVAEKLAFLHRKPLILLVFIWVPTVLGSNISLLNMTGLYTPLAYSWCKW
jgi:hypothetical protein